jgi:hypothetical protein
MSPFVQRALSGEELVAIVAAVERCSAGDAADQAWMLAAPRVSVQAPSCAPRLAIAPEQTWRAAGWRCSYEANRPRAVG